MKRDQARFEQVLKLRESGLSFRAIGEQFGMSPGQAKKIYEQALRQQDRTPHWMDGLGVRVANCLSNLDIDSREAALKAVKDGWLRPGGRKPGGRSCRNYGKKCHEELCAWLGLPSFFSHVPDKFAELRRERIALRQLVTDLWEHRAYGIPEMDLWNRVRGLVPGFHGVRPVDAEGVSIQRDGDYEIKQEK
jgi:hypothetical protein